MVKGKDEPPYTAFSPYCYAYDGNAGHKKTPTAISEGFKCGES